MFSVFSNIRLRLTLWYLLIVAILVTFAGTISYVLLSDSLSRRTIDPWEIRRAKLVPEISGGPGYRVTSFTDIASQMGLGLSTRGLSVEGYTKDELLAMADENGIIKLDSLGFISIDSSLLLTEEMSDVNMIWFYREDTELVVVTQTAYSIPQTLSIFRQALLVTGIITLILAGILGFFLVSRMLRPVQAITKTAREIEENNLNRRLQVQTNDELGSLAKTLNQTFSRLEAAFIREREFTADASHELRTPLAIAQGEASLALKENRSNEEYQRSLESISRQISKTSSLINRLLFLARSDDRLELVLSNVDINSLVAEACADAQVLCEPRDVTLKCNYPDPPEKLTARGDAIRLRELLLNLLDNAVHYTPAGGAITVSLRQDDGMVHISVADTGIGIPQEHLSKIFDRFYRVDKSRSRAEGGAGLGLSISRRIAEVHGGRIEVESEVGRGSTFTVFLPLIKGGK